VKFHGDIICVLIHWLPLFLSGALTLIFISIEFILKYKLLRHIQVKEADQSGDGIESVINKVESYLAEGKLAEAADCLEESVRDTQAAEIVAGWVKQARNRAISEQAVVFLQSYANSICLT
jgi:hypothetical protein